MYANSKDSDQPALMCRLIIALTICIHIWSLRNTQAQNESSSKTELTHKLVLAFLVTSCTTLTRLYKCIGRAIAAPPGVYVASSFGFSKMIKFYI